MKKATIHSLAIATALLLALAATAFAGEDGKGWIDDPNDKVVTYFGLGLVIFFTVFVALASAIQGALGNRRNRQK